MHAVSLTVAQPATNQRPAGPSSRFGTSRPGVSRPRCRGARETPANHRAPRTDIEHGVVGGCEASVPSTACSRRRAAAAAAATDTAALSRSFRNAAERASRGGGGLPRAPGRIRALLGRWRWNGFDPHRTLHAHAQRPSTRSCCTVACGCTRPTVWDSHGSACMLSQAPQVWAAVVGRCGGTWGAWRVTVPAKQGLRERALRQGRRRRTGTAHRGRLGHAARMCSNRAGQTPASRLLQVRRIQHRRLKEAAKRRGETVAVGSSMVAETHPARNICRR